VEMIIPKMGESIIEATVISWLKQVGDEVEEDETILEIATDKVDSEVPAPASGRIKEILASPDDVVAVGAVVAYIETEEGATSIPNSPVQPAEKVVEEVKPVAANTPPSSAEIPPVIPQQPSAQPSKSKAIQLTRKSQVEKIPSSIEGKFFSPLVRNIARAEGISKEELTSLNGSGADGRVTKYDLLNYIDLKKMEATSTIRRAAVVKDSSFLSTPTPQSSISSNIPSTSQAAPQAAQPSSSSFSSSDEVIQLTRMRKMIAKHMRNSLDTAAHVTSFVEADATRVVNWRKRIKEDYKRLTGEKLSLSPLFAEAVIKAIREFPEINATLRDDQIILNRAINLGIATAMDSGDLIVPVIKNAEELSLQGLTKQLNDLTSRARVNKLKPEEALGGTFTISNIGTYGNIMGTPIINQPQLAILALGAIKKKPVIQETAEGDIIAIRHMMFLSLSFDHRLIIESSMDIKVASFSIV